MSTTKTRSAGTKSKTTSEAKNGHQLEKFFIESLKDIYWAEKHLIKALTKMQKASSTTQLQDAISNHIAQTEDHVTRLENIFEKLGEKARGKKCEAMEGLIKEGESAVDETEDGSMVRDAAIIMSAQKVEHYEIATYGTLAQLAETMGQDNIAEILNQTLTEEKETDELLTEIAVNSINWEAEQEDNNGREE
jgi:ferritin-like metal-binding protein YciE